MVLRLLGLMQPEQRHNNMIATTIISLVIFAGFILLGVYKFGLLDSYSAYSDKWAYAVPIKNANLWSIVTMVAAFLMCPVMIESGHDSPWQFLGFATPVYLILVACTPNWAHNIKEHIVHSVGAFLCAGAAVCWLILVRRQLPIAVFSLLGALSLSLATKSLKKSYTFWLEMAMFAAVYVSLLIPGE